MTTLDAKKLDFNVLNHPVKVRIYGDGPQAFAEVSGFNLSAPLTSEQLFDLSIWLQEIAGHVDNYEARL